MDVSAQMDLLGKNFEAGLILEQEYDEAMSDLIAAAENTRVSALRS